MKIEITKAKNPLADLLAQRPSIQAETEFKQLMIVEVLLQIMKQQDINRTELAKRMEVQPSRVTAMLSGSNNFTIETLVRAGRAVGAELHQTFAPEGKKVRWCIFDSDQVHANFKTKPKLQQVQDYNPGFDLKETANDDNSKAA